MNRFKNSSSNYYSILMPEYCITVKITSLDIKYLCELMNCADILKLYSAIPLLELEIFSCLSYSAYVFKW